jgi:DNA-binding NtrC family response regulator
VPLARYFLERLTASSEGAPPRLSASAERALASHSWPGNVRELRNVVEYAAALCTDGVIHAGSLDLGCGAGFASEPAPSIPSPDEPPTTLVPSSVQTQLRDTLKGFERQCIAQALARCDGNQTRAARELGISRRALTNKLTEHGIARPRKLGGVLLRSALPESVQSEESAG